MDFDIGLFGCFCMDSGPEDNEPAYGILSKDLLKRKRKAYEEAEREDGEDGKYNGCDYPREGENILQF